MSDTSDTGPVRAAPEDLLADEAVPDAARAVLSRMRATARARSTPGTTPGRTVRPPGRRSRPRRAVGGYSGPGPDERDPMALGGAWARLVDDSGWRQGLDVAGLHALWPQIVGSANAEHASPESFDPASGVLQIRTSSTAWAEQLRLMLPTLRAAIDGQVGAGVVRDIRIVGPTPPRTKGRLRVRGRGPRDTYG
ncbi:MAG: DciA family protein [Candidatus Nanopelagicales bacterium]